MTLRPGNGEVPDGIHEMAQRPQTPLDFADSAIFGLSPSRQSSPIKVDKGSVKIAE